MSTRTIFCRFCGCSGAKKYGKDRKKRQRYKCPHCNKVFNNRTNTVKSGSHLSDTQWKLATKLFATRGGMSGVDLGRVLDVHYKTGQKLNRKMRGLLKPLVPNNLPGVSEWDESKMSTHWVLGGVSRTNGQCMMGIIPSRRSFTLEPIVKRHTDAEGLVLTDEWGGYNGIPNRLSVCHSKEYVNSQMPFVHTNTQEGIWGHLKPLGKHVYRGFPSKHLPFYLQEFMFRYNVRDYKTRVSVLSSLLTRKTNSLLS